MQSEKKMETQFYDDTPNTTAAGIGNGHWTNKKKTMTLNFDLKSNKKSVLSTPDVQMLQLASPELEKFINQQGNICTTPTPTQFICPKNVTEEQSAFAQGFVEALQSLHECGNGEDASRVEQSPKNLQVLQQVEQPCVIAPSSIPVTGTNITSLSGATTTCYDPVLTSATTIPGSSVSLPVYSTTSYSSQYTSPDSVNTVAPAASWSDTHHHIEAIPAMPHIKIEPGTEPPQTVPVFHAAPSAQCLDLSPIDMETQERIKSERKRLRNRIAASKCRKRKLERISRLEDKVQELKSQNADLQAAATKLREQVCKLKEGVMEHVKCGCQVMLAQQLAF